MTVFAAVEDWDKRINFWLPNTCEKDWFENQNYLNTLGDYLTKDYMKSGAIPDNVTPEYRDVLYTHKSELMGKELKYVYLVSILNVLYFAENAEIGFDHVDEQILDDVRKGYCQIIFIQDTEGMSGMPNTSTEYDFLLIEKWCENKSLPTKNVHYICANLLSKEVATKQGCTFNVVPLTVQDIWINIENFPDHVMEFNPIDEKYLYLNYSRRPRYHRVFFYSTLLKEGVFDIGTNSFNDMGWPIPLGDLHESDPEIPPYAKKLFEMSPVTIDRENASDDITLYMNLNDYERTFISVVTETLYEEDILFNSEKVWKPIIVGHPFLLLGNKGHLQWLRNEGFKTFGKWIDESYDQMDKMEDRSNKIVSEIKRLKTMSIGQLMTIREEMKPICEHNKNLMKQRVKDRFYEGNDFERLLPTSKEIHKIYENIIIEEPKRNLI